MFSFSIKLKENVNLTKRSQLFCPNKTTTFLEHIWGAANLNALFATSIWGKEAKIETEAK